VAFVADNKGTAGWGSDDGFPPADHDLVGSLRHAGFSADEIHWIAEQKPRRLFRLT
jgi:hypothetical protein